MPYFELKRTPANQYMFNLKGDNHAVVLTSEQYMTRQGAMNGIAAVRSSAAAEARYSRMVAANGGPYFVLRAGNGEAIGVSETYASVSSMEEAVAFVKKWGPWAAIREGR